MAESSQEQVIAFRQHLREYSRGKQRESRGAFCCACSVNFGFMRQTAGIRLRRFSDQNRERKEAVK